MKAFKVTFAISLASMMMLCQGCGKSSNPLGDYNGLKSQPLSPSTDQAKPAKVQRGPFFDVQVAGNNDKSFANFTEGKENAVSLAVQVKESKVQDYVLTPVQMPSGATLTKVNGEWLLKWTPPKGTVPPGKASIEVPVKVQARVTQASDSTLVNSTDPAQTFQITVQNGEQTPTVLGLDGLKSDVNTGDYFSFSVDVQDPSTDQTPPVLERYPYASNPEAVRQRGNPAEAKADGSGYLKSVSVVKVRKNVWRYNLIFDARGADLSTAKVKSINSCLNLVATSSASGDSASPKEVCVNVHQKPAATASPSSSPSPSTSKGVRS